MLVPAIDRRGPAFGSASRRRFQDVERLLDGGLLLLRCHFEEMLVLGVAMAFDEVSRAYDLPEHLRVELSGQSISEDRGARVAAIEDAQNAPNALLAAILRPLDPSMVDGAKPQRRGAGEVGR